MMSNKYQNPFSDGVREKRGNLQVMRHKYGDFEIWETIPNTLPDGRVMRIIGEHIELDDGTYVVVDVTESNALCESLTRKIVQRTEDGEEICKDLPQKFEGWRTILVFCPHEYIKVIMDTRR